MADRTSASIFAMVFEMLAKHPTEEHKAFARRLWPARLGYDFADCQMECNEALEVLGLARPYTYTEDGETYESTEYAEADGTFKERANG